MSDSNSLYEKDFVLWSRQQAEALRGAARGRTNQPIDWENVAEEIDGLARSEKRELASRLSLIIEHLAKLDHSPTRYPRRRWRETVRRERAEVERILDDSPSLRREVEDLIRREMPQTIARVIEDLVERGELGRSRGRNLPVETGYNQEQVLGNWFPVEPARPKRRGE